MENCEIMDMGGPGKKKKASGSMIDDCAKWGKSKKKHTPSSFRKIKIKKKSKVKPIFREKPSDEDGVFVPEPAMDHDIADERGEYLSGADREEYLKKKKAEQAAKLAEIEKNQ